MECRDARALLQAGADDELGAAESLRLEQHLDGCPGCRAELQALRALRAAVREGAPYYRADAALRARLLAALPGGVAIPQAVPAATAAVHTTAHAATHGATHDAPHDATHDATHGIPERGSGVPAEHARSAPAPARQPARARPRWLHWLRWFDWPPAANAAMAALTVATLSLGLVRYAQLGPQADSLANALVDSHVRALLSGRSYDVASSDRHTVKPWFNGRLDYAPPVYDLATHGFPLVGGRLDHVAGRTVAVLVYRRNLHPIDVFVLPADAARQAGAMPVLRDGYVLESWRAGDMRLWAVSDAGAPELRGLREAWLQAYEADMAASGDTPR